MKTSFKVVKTRGIASTSQDESMMMNVGLPKSEREFLSFLKGKIDEKIQLMGQQSSLNTGSTQITPPSETNFSLLYQVSTMALQHKFNENVNYLGIGMKEGSILVWDVEEPWCLLDKAMRS